MTVPQDMREGLAWLDPRGRGMGGGYIVHLMADAHTQGLSPTQLAAFLKSKKQVNTSLQITAALNRGMLEIRNGKYYVVKVPAPHQPDTFWTLAEFRNLERGGVGEDEPLDLSRKFELANEITLARLDKQARAIRILLRRIEKLEKAWEEYANE